MTKARFLVLSMFLGVAGSVAFGPEAHSAVEAPKVAPVTVNAPVTLTDNGDSWTLGNGIVTLTILKRNGNPTSLIYHGIEILTHGPSYWEQVPSGTVTASVTINPATNGGERAEVSVKGVNPGSGTGAPGSGPGGQGGAFVPGSGAGTPRAGRGAPGAGGAPGGAGGPRGGQGGPRGGPGGGRGGMDIETRYTLERGASGFYTYAAYTHHASYPAAGEGESRFILQDMNPTFDWLSVDKDRNQLMSNAPEDHPVHAKEQSIYTTGLYKNSVEHKYSYNAPMYKLQAWGWSSTKDHIGVYFMNPSTEYITGGPERLDLIDHFSAPGSKTYQPIILDYWTSGHYAGGASNSIPAGQEWTHVVGPIFVYMNRLATPQEPSQAELDHLHASYGSGMPDVPPEWSADALTLWDDAVAKSKQVKAAWPYAWVQGMEYPQKADRGTVTGQLVLDDAQAASKKLPNLNIGLTAPNYQDHPSPRAATGDIVTWPHDGEHYQFWTEGAEDGRFTITNVRPGTYTLRAFANGVLGEYDRAAQITVEAGKSVNLGKLDWQPVRYGRQIWEIGYPDRTGDKFFKGDGANYWLWGWGLRYSGLFPHDITYTIGKSDYHKDWFFQEVPHSTTTAWLNPDAKDPYNQRFGWVAIPPTDADPWREWGQGRATTWTVKFNMPKTAKGTAILRVALAGADGGNGNEASSPGNLTIGVNGQTVGTIRTVATNALRYNTNKGVWYQYLQKFDAAQLKQGENEMTFTVPAGDITTGVVWDYIRLELNDGSKPYPTPPDTQRPDFPTLPAAAGATQAEMH